MKRDTLRATFVAELLESRTLLSQLATDHGFAGNPALDGGAESTVIDMAEGGDIHQPATIDGDVNGDGRINHDDYLLLNQTFVAGGQQADPAADLNGDGIIDGDDYYCIDHALLRAIAAQGAAAYDQLPEIYQRPDGDHMFASLLASLQNDKGTMARFGDSIWSCYSGVCTDYNAVLWAGMQAMYEGRLWGTPLEVSSSVGGPVSQSAAFGAAPFDVGVIARGPACQYPVPMIDVYGANHMGLTTMDAAWPFLLKHDYGSARSFCDALSGERAFPTDEGVIMRVYAASFEGSDTVLACPFIPDIDDIPSGMMPMATATVVNPALDSATWGIHATDLVVTPEQWPNRETNPYAQFRIRSGTAGKSVAVVAARFVNPADDACGLVPDNYSAPGYRSTSYPDLHGDSWATVAAMSGPLKVVDIGFGVNDGGVTSLADYKAAMRSMIAGVRAAAGDDVFFILHSPTLRNDLTAEKQAVFDAYAGVLHQMAVEDPMIRFHNDRLSLERTGWTKETHSAWAVDVAHPNNEAQMTMANVHLWQMQQRLPAGGETPTFVAHAAEGLHGE